MSKTRFLYFFGLEGCMVNIYKLQRTVHGLLTRFSTKILVIRLVNGGQAGRRLVERAGGRILNGVKLRFPLNNFSLLWPIDTKLAV